MAGFDQWFHASASLPVWLAGALAALAVFGGALAFGRAGQTGRTGTAWRFALILVGAGLAWILADSLGSRDQSAARRSLDARATELTLRALAQGSPLACLEALANPTVEEACEKSVFASAESVAAAVAYIDARIGLLADGFELAARDRAYAASIERQRRGIESDRFGLVAHVLTMRGCNAERCDGLKLLRDPQRVIANLRDRNFEANVVLYATAWRSDGQTQPAGVAGPAVAAAPSVTTTGAAPTTGKIDYPSAASIPAISIMNAEPPLSQAEANATANAVPQNAPGAAKPAAPLPQPRRQSAREPAPPPPLPPPGTQSLPQQTQSPQQQVQQPTLAAPVPAAPPAPSIPRWGSGN